MNNIKMRAKMFTGPEATYEAIPESFAEIAKRSREILDEAIAEVSDELMEKFFAGESFTEEEIKDAGRQDKLPESDEMESEWDTAESCVSLDGADDPPADILRLEDRDDA